MSKLRPLHCERPAMSYFSEHSVLMLWVGKLKVFVLIAMLVHVSFMAFYGNLWNQNVPKWYQAMTAMIPQSGDP